MLSHKQPSFYPLLVLFALALTSFAVQPSITLNGANSQPSTYVINDVSVDDGSYFIQPEFINESYLFLPISQVSFSTAHMFTTENFEFHQVHVGAKYHYYQTDKHVIMGKVGDSGLKFVNYAEISVPDIIFSQQKCTHLAVDPREIYSISACTDTSDNSIYLIMISYVSSRPTYVQSLKTSIKEVAQMKLVGKFLYVLDHDETTNTNNKLHIYKVNIGGTATAKQAMDIVGYIDQAPFGADKVDIGSFDVAVFETAQKVFMADKNFGLRTIDINTEDIKLYNAFSNPIANNIVSVAIHTCDTKSCYLVVSSKDSSIGYASWGRNGQASAFDFISTFSLPKHVTINEKLTIKDNFLAVMSQADEGNRLHFFSIPTGRFASSIAPIGAVSYRPVSSYQNDFFIDCIDQEDDSCKLYVPNPVNHLEEYILRPHFAVKIQPHELKSTYFNLVPRFNPSSPTKKVMINKPGQAQSPMAAVAPQPNVASEPVVETVSEQEAYMAIIEQFRPTSIPVFPVAVNKYMQQQLNAAQQTRFYGAPRQIKASSSSSDSDTDEPLTTFHGWFIIFLIILGILAAVAYFTNKPEQKAPASRSANVVEAPSSFAPSYIAPSVVEPLRAPLVESVSEDQVVDVHYRKFEDKFENRYEENLENQGNAEGDLLKVDTGLENDAHEIDLEASK